MRVIVVKTEEAIDERYRLASDFWKVDLEGTRRMRDGVLCGNELDALVAREETMRREARGQDSEQNRGRAGPQPQIADVTRAGHQGVRQDRRPVGVVIATIVAQKLSGFPDGDVRYSAEAVETPSSPPRVPMKVHHLRVGEAFVLPLTPLERLTHPSGFR